MNQLEMAVLTLANGKEAHQEKSSCNGSLSAAARSGRGWSRSHHQSDRLPARRGAHLLGMNSAVKMC